MIGKTEEEIRNEHVRTGEEACFARHKRWSDEWLTGKVKVLIITMMATFILAGGGMYAYISANQIMANNVRNDERYISKSQYEREYSRLDTQMTQMRMEVNIGFEKIADRLEQQRESMARVSAGVRR